MANQELKPIQISFGAKDQYRYTSVIDLLYDESLPKGMRNHVAKELMLLGASTGVALQKLLSGVSLEEIIGEIGVVKEPPKKEIQQEPKQIEPPKASRSLANMA